MGNVAECCSRTKINEPGEDMRGRDLMQCDGASNKSMSSTRPGAARVHIASYEEESIYESR